MLASVWYYLVENTSQTQFTLFTVAVCFGALFYAGLTSHIEVTQRENEQKERLKQFLTEIEGDGETGKKSKSKKDKKKKDKAKQATVDTNGFSARAQTGTADKAVGVSSKATSEESVVQDSTEDTEMSAALEMKTRQSGPRVLKIVSSADSASQQKSKKKAVSKPEALTKKQRENQRKKEKEKEIKDLQREEQEQRLREFKQQKAREAIAEVQRKEREAKIKSEQQMQKQQQQQTSASAPAPTPKPVPVPIIDDADTWDTVKAKRSRSRKSATIEAPEIKDSRLSSSAYVWDN
ncbi:hypothetical protein V1511DRAFT_314974 [Dipodascopsis uninucleata]